MKIKFSYLLIALSLAFFTTSCDDDDDPTPPNEEELITTLTLTFSPQGGGNEKIFEFRDPDGPGGNNPSIIADELDENTVYDVSITLLNESEDPAEDITEEVMEEDDEHQFFFDITGGVSLTHEYADQDDDGNPIGLENTFTTGLPSTGIMTVTLRHEPDKDAAGVSDGDITNAGGETDIEVTFNVTIL